MTGIKTFAIIFGLFIAGLLAASLLNRINDPATKDAAITTDLPANSETPKYERIICLSPSITEIVFALEAQEAIVAVSGFCNYPPAAQSFPQVGSYLNPNFERILAFKPDLIIYQGKFEKMTQFCQTSSLPCLNVKLDIIQDAFDSIGQIGDMLGRSSQAQSLCVQIRSELQRIRDTVKDRKPVPVFISMWRTPDSFTNLATVSSKTFIHELVEIAGGRNIFSDTQTRYPSVSKESLLKRRPEAIIEIQPEAKNNVANRKAITQSWKTFPSLPAVQDQKIHVMADSYLFIPGPRFALAARQLAERLHPEAFDD